MGRFMDEQQQFDDELALDGSASGTTPNPVATAQMARLRYQSPLYWDGMSYAQAAGGRACAGPLLGGAGA